MQSDDSQFPSTSHESDFEQEDDEKDIFENIIKVGHLFKNFDLNRDNEFEMEIKLQQRMTLERTSRMVNTLLTYPGSAKEAEELEQVMSTLNSGLATLNTGAKERRQGIGERGAVFLKILGRHKPPEVKSKKTKILPVRPQTRKEREREVSTRPDRETPKQKISKSHAEDSPDTPIANTRTKRKAALSAASTPTNNTEKQVKTPIEKKENGTAIKQRKSNRLSKTPRAPTRDEDEQTYCFCSRVSFGEMIGCDNDKCEIEWFHFECIGLTTKPKGKWFCPNCRHPDTAKMPKPAKGKKEKE